MAKPPKLLTSGLWPRLRELAQRPGRIWVAAPYFSQGGALRLPLKRGDLLVTRFDDVAIKSGLTDPREILKLLKRGVSVHSVVNLHDKVYVFGHVSVVGSANVSAFSEHYLAEAAFESNDATAARACRQWVEALTGDVIEPDYAEAKIPLYRPPRHAVPVRRHSLPRRNGAVVHQSRLWVIRLGLEDWDDDARHAEREALADGASQIAQPEAFRQDTFRLAGESRFSELRVGQRVLQLLDASGPTPAKVFAPGRIVAVKKYERGLRKCAIVSLAMRRGVKTKNLRDVVRTLGKSAEIVRRTKGQRLLRNRNLVYELGRLWKHA